MFIFNIHPRPYSKNILKVTIRQLIFLPILLDLLLVCTAAEKNPPKVIQNVF